IFSYSTTFCVEPVSLPIGRDRLFVTIFCSKKTTKGFPLLSLTQKKLSGFSFKSKKTDLFKKKSF
ncbi:MAG: hypothetical protein ACTIJT_10920, partial [Mesonia sp.]